MEKTKKYKIEEVLEKLFTEVRLSLRRLTLFVTKIPSGKEERKAYMIEIVLGFILILSGILIIWNAVNL